MRTVYQPLLAIPPSEWITRQVVILDWYDGPRAGLCALAHPPCCVWFQIVGEQINILGEKLFQLHMAPPAAMDELLDTLSELGPPRVPSWGVIWRFETERAEQEADKYIHALLQGLEPSSLFVQSYDLLRFSNAWNAFPDVPFFKIGQREEPLQPPDGIPPL